ncbi:MAG: hypothetical protein SVS15_08755, partial [Thermodesulfobacteriota bacterium]|nr:hypothetical protein [Thermodesulfobacteriota bacterium]
MNKTAAMAGVRLAAGNIKEIKLATFEKWLNPTDREHMPSTLAINIFCDAVQDYGALVVQAGTHGRELIGPEDRMYRDLGRAYMDNKEARKKMREIEEGL